MVMSRERNDLLMLRSMAAPGVQGIDPCKREKVWRFSMTRNDFKQWLYRGKQWLYREQRPNWIARILNRAWAAVASSGAALPRDIRTDRPKGGADHLAAVGD